MGIVNINSQINQLNNNTNEVYFNAAKKNLGNDRMDRSGFMRLMLEQLRNQDPTNPMDNSEMLANQLQLEQADMMQDLISSNSLGQGADLVGKTVTLPDQSWNFEQGVNNPQARDVFSGEYLIKTGEVEAVQFDKVNNKNLLLIDGEFYDMDLMTQVSQTIAEEPEAE